MNNMVSISSCTAMPSNIKHFRNFVYIRVHFHNLIFIILMIGTDERTKVCQTCWILTKRHSVAICYSSLFLDHLRAPRLNVIMNNFTFFGWIYVKLGVQCWGVHRKDRSALKTFIIAILYSHPLHRIVDNFGNVLANHFNMSPLTTLHCNITEL